MPYLILAILAALLSPPPPTKKAPSVEPVVKAEFASAADALARGTKAAFLASMHPDSAICFSAAAPVPARAYWLARPAPDTLTDPVLRWAPALAGIAASGELGYTTGPWLLTNRKGKGLAAGLFFTIWARQPDGTWRWLLDDGTEVGVNPTRRSLEPAHAVIDIGPAGVPVGRGKARSDVRALDTELSADIATHGMLGAYETRLNPQVRLLREEAPPVTEMVTIRRRLFEEPPRTLTPAGGRTSAAGDLAYSYGTYRNQISGGGAYVHLWLHEKDGWQLLIELLNPAPGGAK